MTAVFSLERRLVKHLLALYAVMLLVAVVLHLVDAAILRGVEMGEGLANGLQAVQESISPELALTPSPALEDMAAGPDFGLAVLDGDRLITLGHPPAGAEAFLRLREADMELRDGRHAVVREIVHHDRTIAVMLVRQPVPRDVAAWIWHELAEELLPVLVPLFLASLIVVPMTVRRSLVALHRISAQVAATGPDSSTTGLDGAALPREIAPLVSAVDRALTRLQASLAQQRRFTANAAHALRTPLAVLRTRLDDLPDSADRRALLADAQRLARIVAQLLAMARLECGGTETRARIDLADMCAEVVEDIAPLAIASGKDICLERPPLPVAFDGDRAALLEAAGNLVDNALRFCPAGGTVSVLLDGDGTIRVRDSGPGVPAAEREQIFEAFWSGRRAGGAGLGLAIVAETARAHGGTIEVADAPGGGAEFVLRLPPPDKPSDITANSSSGNGMARSAAV